MKVRKSLWTSLFVILIVVLSGCSSNNPSSGELNQTSEGSGDSEDKSEVIKLKVADSVPKSNFISKEGIVFWMDRVEELTDGSVEFEYYPAEQLGKAASLLDLTQSKTTDIGYISYATEKIPLTDLMSLPGAVTSPIEGSKIYWDLAQNILLEEEYLKAGVRPILTGTLPPYQMITMENKIEDISDFKNLKVRTSGAMDFTIQLLGGNPVSMPGPEVYTAFERGTIDSVAFPLTSYEPYQLHEIGKYSTTNANMGSFSVIYAINEEVYQELPDDIKKAMAQASDEAVAHFASFLDDQINSLIDEFSQAGMTMYQLDDSTLEKINQEVQPAWDEWAQGLEKRGIPANDVIEAYKESKQNLE